MPATRSAKVRGREVTLEGGGAGGGGAAASVANAAGERKAFGDVSNNKFKVEPGGKGDGRLKSRKSKRTVVHQPEGGGAVPADTEGNLPPVLFAAAAAAAAATTTRGSRHKDEAETEVKGADRMPESVSRNNIAGPKTRSKSKDNGEFAQRGQLSIAVPDKHKIEGNEPNKVKRVKRVDEEATVQPRVPVKKTRARKAARGKTGVSGTRGRKTLWKLDPTKDLCSDFYAQSSFTLQQTDFDVSKYTFGIAVIDRTNKENVLSVTQYATDIYQRLFNAELEHAPLNYIGKQSEINEIMRAILVDWLVEVHMKFRLATETLYLCINLIDRYLSAALVPRRNLQLVGVTSLLLACKYEEIYPPEVRDCVYITDRAYTRQEVLDMEQDIVKKLEFKMTVPTAYPFLVRFLQVTKASVRSKHAANFYLERTLQEYKFVSMRPSLIAAAAVCLALNNKEIRALDEATIEYTGVPPSLLEYTGFLKDDVTDCAKQIIPLLQEEVVTLSRRKLEAVRRKFAQSRYYAVARIADPDTDGW